MNRIRTFNEFLASQSVAVPVGDFLLSLALAALLSHLLSRLYIRFGSSLSNRRAFASNFVLVTMATVLVISIVKSSLALSLGMVGALSIVRFRAAIKEPEELAFLFLAIALGLGFGADQRAVTTAAFLAIAAVLWASSRFRHGPRAHNLLLTVASRSPRRLELSEIVEALTKHCSAVHMKRFDEGKESLEASFLVEFEDFRQLQQGRSRLRDLNEHVQITFLDTDGTP